MNFVVFLCVCVI